MEVELSGSQILMQFLKDEGVEFIFGYPGGAVLQIYDEIYAQEDVQHILVRHEQGATHMADGYARATGKPGVVLVTSGPGATNAVTGIATAHMDSVPMVVITGQVPTHAIGSDAFQEVDCVGITRPCVKHNFLVKDVRDLADTLKKAFYVANTGRPGSGRRRHPQGRDRAQCQDTVRISGQRDDAFVQSRGARPSGADEEGARPDPVREASHGLHRGRCGARRRRGRAGQVHTYARLPHHEHADGSRCVSRDRSAVRRHAGDARHVRSEHGHAPLRRAHRDRSPLRRPGGRGREQVLPRGAHRPHRHRSRVDLEDGQGARAHRRLGLERARRDQRHAGRHEPPAGCAGALRVVGADSSLEIDRLPRLLPLRDADQAAVGSAEAL